jgi:UDP-N-acetylmuramate dehydrogenase
MNILENISLKAFNTFGIDKKTKFFSVAKSTEELKSLLQWARSENENVFILGGGSNILLTQDLDLLVIKNEIVGIKLVSETDDHAIIEVGAGVDWHDLVCYAIAQNWGGIENLSLIPGTVGASPMQNIGAYGVEIKEVFESLTALDRSDLSMRKFEIKDCRFGYRESIFKHELKDKYVICTVSFRLQKFPEFKTSYGSIQDILKAQGIEKLSLKAISNAVISIRQSKLPDPKKIGNSGSFFKNPTVSIAEYENLKKIYSEMPGYPNENGIKIPAAWLIEQTGWKGKRFGDVGVHQHQPLVLVNYGNGEGSEIVDLARKIQKSIYDQFQINLSPEVNFI